MAHEVRAWLAAAAALAGVVGTAPAQPTPAPAQPAPVICATSGSTPSVDPWDLIAPISNPYLTPPAEGHFEDDNGDILVGDPFLDPGRLPGPGFFFGVETTILAPSFNNRLTGPVTVPGLGGVLVSVPTASLPWTAAPEFRVGYRLPQGFGSFSLTYRFITDQGTSVTPGFVSTGAPDLRALLGLGGGVPPFLLTGPGSLTSRLNVNVIGIDYQTQEYSLGPNWDVRWTAGAWIVTNFFDSRVQGTMLEQRVSSNEIAAGPHIGVELWRWLSGHAGQGLALYGKTEGAFTVGRIDQNFESVLIGAGGVPIAGGATKLTGDPLAVSGSGGTQFLPILRTQAGLTWSPAWAQQLRFSTGYAFEGWWWVGRLPGPTGNSNRLGSGSTLITNGVFLRAEWKY